MYWKILNWCAIQYTPLPLSYITAIGAVPGSSALAHVGVMGKKQENMEDNAGSQDTSWVLSIATSPTETSKAHSGQGVH